MHAEKDENKQNKENGAGHAVHLHLTWKRAVLAKASALAEGIHQHAEGLPDTSFGFLGVAGLRAAS
jgi:hypothetical protein